MIVDLQRFIATERPIWTELESVLNRLEADPTFKMPLEQLQHFHEVYERTGASLAKLATFSSEPQTRRYLENLISRAYGEIQETRAKRRRIQPLNWIMRTFPQTFRRRIATFYLALALTLAGSAFGALATAFDPDSRHVTMPFGHGDVTPTERVWQEEHPIEDPLAGNQTSFSAYLMTHNIKVSIFTLALGATWGLGTILLLFYNGIGLGAIATDYVLDGQSRFLMGWLMPHGVIEIPAILVAGQAGLLLAAGLIGWGQRISIRARLREVSRDIVTLSLGFALMLLWAGLVEAFLSQSHEPAVSYDAKIVFGAIEFALLGVYLMRAGR